MVARSPARYLAPLALLATVTATVVIVSDADSGHPSPPRRPIARSRVFRTATSRQRAATFYVVRSGDSLSAISVRTGISVAALEALNPGISPDALQTGQRLRLRR